VVERITVGTYYSPKVAGQYPSKNHIYMDNDESQLFFIPERVTPVIPVANNNCK